MKNEVFLLRFLQKTCSNLEFTPDYCMFFGEILKGKLYFSRKKHNKTFALQEKLNLANKGFTAWKVKFSFKDYIRKHAVFWSFTPEYCMFSDVILKGKLHFSCSDSRKDDKNNIDTCIHSVKYCRIRSRILPYKAIRSPYTVIYGIVFGSISHCDNFTESSKDVSTH